MLISVSNDNLKFFSLPEDSAFQPQTIERYPDRPVEKLYRDTPHPATGIAPAAMLFRDGQKYGLPRQSATPAQVE